MHVIRRRLPLSIRVSPVRPKDDRAMRIETVINAPRDLRCNAHLPNLATYRTRRTAVPGEDPPPGESALELDRIYAEYNSVRLHAAIGYVTRRARRPRSDPPGAAGPHRIPSEHHPEETQRSRAARGCVFPPRPGSLSRHIVACHSNAISRTVAGTLPLSAESAARPRPSVERESAVPRITAPWRIPQRSAGPRVAGGLEIRPLRPGARTAGTRCRGAVRGAGT